MITTGATSKSEPVNSVAQHFSNERSGTSPIEKCGIDRANDHRLKPQGRKHERVFAPLLIITNPKMRTTLEKYIEGHVTVAKMALMPKLNVSHKFNDRDNVK